MYDQYVIELERFKHFSEVVTKLKLMTAVSHDPTYPMPPCKICKPPCGRLHPINPNKTTYNAYIYCTNCKSLTGHGCTADTVLGDDNYNHVQCLQCRWWKFNYMTEYANPETTLDLSFPTDIPIRESNGKTSGN